MEQPSGRFSMRIRPDAGLSPAPILLVIVLVVVLVAGAFAVPPNPQSWDLDAGVHQSTGNLLPEMPPWIGVQGGQPPLPTPPLMGAVAVLVQFPDHLAHTGAHPQSAYQELLFSQGVYPTGSLRDYWNTVSYGQFDLSGDVAGWFTTVDNYNYNYNDQNFGLSWGGSEVARAAALLADPTVDFGQFDNDGPDGIPNSGDDDGIVDLFMVYHAGPDGADTGDPNDIWSHMSYLGYTTNDAAAGGGYIYIEDYDIQAEERQDGTLSGISVACHEMGHLLGLPDQYDYSRYDLGTGLWSLMSYGAWGADGLDDRYPSYLDAWSRSELGWTTVVNLDQDQDDLVVPPAETDATVYTLWRDGSPDYDEWFYLENRQQLPPEPTLVGEGLLIYHIYSGAHGFGFDYSDLDIEQADGLDDLDNGDGERPDPDEDNIGDDGDPFPGSTGNTRFAHDTDPSSDDDSGQPTWIEVSDIRHSGDDILCDITLQSQDTGELLLEAVGREEGLVLRWAGPAEAATYRLSRLDSSWTVLADGLRGCAYLDRRDAGTARYRLEALSADGRVLADLEREFAYTPPPSARVSLALWPNPCRGGLTISLELAEDDTVELAFYDLSGRRVALLHRGELTAGRRLLTRNLELESGVYLLRLDTASTVLTERVVIDR
ncbi:MAG: M6 family metalloprotease domain-containing protein [Candidatus Coatesbacteria bacterium]|nr:M6 family metalloprotease domain-containing protein [Candidatus Coatesbacteria bacterium]